MLKNQDREAPSVYLTNVSDETCFQFASEISKHWKVLASPSVIGTDGEEQLNTAFATVFLEAAKLLSVLHKQDNI